MKPILEYLFSKKSDLDKINTIPGFNKRYLRPGTIVELADNTIGVYVPENSKVYQEAKKRFHFLMRKDDDMFVCWDSMNCYLPISTLTNQLKCNKDHRSDVVTIYYDNIPEKDMLTNEFYINLPGYLHAFIQNHPKCIKR